jgi:hypothetical protein
MHVIMDIKQKSGRILRAVFIPANEKTPISACHNEDYLEFFCPSIKAEPVCDYTGCYGAFICGDPVDIFYFDAIKARQLDVPLSTLNRVKAWVTQWRSTPGKKEE